MFVFSLLNFSVFLLQMKVTAKTELEEWIQQGNDISHAFIFTSNFIGETHIDSGDVNVTDLTVFDVGDNSNCGCKLEQDLCFPMHGFSVALVDRHTILFRSGYAHNASTIRKSNPTCSCVLTRCSVVCFGKKSLLLSKDTVKKNLKQQGVK